MRGLLALIRPQIAHAHNIYHHLSPSVLVELHRQRDARSSHPTRFEAGLPCLQDAYSGRDLRGCRGGALRNVIKNRCIKDSTAMSALVWLESTVHKTLDIYMRNVTRFVVPSRFFLDQIRPVGRRYQPLRAYSEFDRCRCARGKRGARRAFVYLGRLVPEKGVATLVQGRRAGAGAIANHRHRSRRGLPCANSPVNSAATWNLPAILSGPELRAAISSARAVVIPSEWYENAPFSVMEASALARPVIGANIGGIPELIRQGETGFVFPERQCRVAGRGARAACSGCRRRALRAIGAAGREWMRTEFSPAAYRERMFALYSEIGVTS